MTWMTHTMNHIRRAGQFLLAIGLTASISVSEAALLSLADSPPYLITPVEPNILLTFDDSGSMAWGYLPDCVDGGASCTAPYLTSTLENTRRGCSRPLNGMAYDPGTTYSPPVNADGVALNAVATSFTSAYINGFNPAGATPQNLSNGYRYKWEMNSAGTGYSTVGRCATGTSAGQAAYYYVYDPTGTGCSPATNTNDNCYTRVTVGTTSGPGGTDERQNFANWFSYYSTRNLLAKTSAGRAFSRFGSNVRISGQHLNNTTAGTGAGMMFTQTITPMRKFMDGAPTGTTYRTDFFRRLYNSPANNSTPLRQAMYRAGEHFGSGNTGANSPYRDTPGDSSTAERSCRQNFHIMMTDGYWNGSGGTYVTGDRDGIAQSLPDGTAYSAAQRPYSDAAPGTPTSGTLADGSFNYWYRDLRTDLTNNVPTRFTEPTRNYWNPANDPANWQRMVSYTIGLGIPGTMDATNATTYSNLLNGTIGWPAPADGNITGANVDDLWHAALNARGRYFSAQDPTQLVAAFTAIVSDVLDRLGSASSGAVNAGALSTSSYYYQAQFDSGNWAGGLAAYAISPSDGSLTFAWDAGELLNNANYPGNVFTTRTVLTYKPSNGDGIAFRWPANPATPAANELDTAQIDALKVNPISGATEADAVGQARLNYVRGDASNESTGYGFRPRDRSCGAAGTCSPSPNTAWLGDIVNSAPVYVGKPNNAYVDPAYQSWKTLHAGRTPMLYVGANDGMLHGFHANTGNELLAYVPSPVYRNLNRLTAVPYAHKYFVDGTPTVADAVVNGDYHSILVGSLRGGGQGIFALDVTNPSTFSETSPGNTVLWEFHDGQDPDMGYSFSEPVIAKMNDGPGSRWAVIVGNGYNNSEPDGAGRYSTTGTAVLYILFIEAGIDGTWDAADFVKIDTLVGAAGTPNGLSSPAIVDIDGNDTADFIYAGDLYGNMWRFDVRGTSGNWAGSGNRRTIFAGGAGQPITSRPEVGQHPAGLIGNMVYFGTGKYIEPSDAATGGTPVQTFYGVWDKLTASTVSRTDLLQQTVIATQTAGGGEFRVVSDNPMVWRTASASSPNYLGWRLDLPTAGERVVANPMLREQAIVFATAVPSSDPCRAGGDGWVMLLDANNGGRFSEAIFDTNGDRTFSNADMLAVPFGGSTTLAAPGGLRFANNMPSIPTIIDAGNPFVGGGCGGSACAYNPDNGNTRQTTLRMPCNWCRASWRQLR